MRVLHDDLPKKFPILSPTATPTTPNLMINPEEKQTSCKNKVYFHVDDIHNYASIKTLNAYP